MAIVFGLQYILYFKIAGSAYTTNGKLLGLIPVGKTQSKSLVIFMLLVIVSIYRDKFEKKISSTYEPARLHFGRAMLTPLAYVSFTLMMILDQSIGSLLVASLYQLGYLYFYIDDAKYLMLGIKQDQE